MRQKTQDRPDMCEDCGKRPDYLAPDDAPLLCQPCADMRELASQ